MTQDEKIAEMIFFYKKRIKSLKLQIKTLELLLNQKKGKK